MNLVNASTLIGCACFTIACAAHIQPGDASPDEPRAGSSAAGGSAGAAGHAGSAGKSTGAGGASAGAGGVAGTAGGSAAGASAIAGSAGTPSAAGGSGGPNTTGCFDGSGVPGAMTAISRGAPVHGTLPTYYPASYANDGDFDSTWRSQGVPAALAYDLSGAPEEQRKDVTAVYYNNAGAYFHKPNELGYNNAGAYTLDANAAPGGTLPSDGWVTLVSVSGNVYHSRQHQLSLEGYNWLRIAATSSDGSPQNFDVALNFDVYDASCGVDDWIFYGDSITWGGMSTVSILGTKPFAGLIEDALSDRIPIAENAGLGGTTSKDGVDNMDAWLALFPGHYVGISYGSNDAGGISAEQFGANYESMIQKVLAAGKVPVIPYMPWARVARIQSNGPLLNAAIDALYAAHPEVVHGPDLWTYFSEHQELISGDDLHPSEAGYAAYRSEWAKAMLANVYGQ